MNIDFSADEVFEMAEQIERNGARFYRRAAEGVLDSGERRMFLELAAMEQNHERVFASMREELSTSDRTAAAFDPQGEGALYLRAMADGHVFDPKADPVDFFKDQHTQRDILKKALDLEKDSIIFYLGIKEVVPERLGKGRIEEIIKEEMRHIVFLNGELTARGPSG
ncbi:MAG: ferritin family protein [Deltaproteobacteria bacterium]|nr:ferritin family protein [Deltaproteobacteria bacterium]